MKSVKENSNSWKEWFDRSAEYNEDPRLKMAYQISGQPVPMEVIQATMNDVYTKLSLSSESSLLDVGGGVGLFSQIFRQKLKCVITTDISFNMAKSGRKLTSGDYVVCESGFLPFTSSCFDRLLCYSVFHYLGTLERVKETILEFLRVVNNDGLILLGDIPLKQNTVNQQEKKDYKKPSQFPDFLRHNLKTLTFDPNFFTDIASSHNFECKILNQKIEGKVTALNRFDVLIRVSK